MRQERSPLETLYVRGSFVVFIFNSASCWERCALAGAAHQAFLDAGEPLQLNSPGGRPIILAIVPVLLSGQLWSGHLGGAAEAAAKSLLGRLDKAHLGTLLTLWEACEAIWEPATSRRVAPLQQRRAQCIAAGRPVRWPRH